MTHTHTHTHTNTQQEVGQLAARKSKKIRFTTGAKIFISILLLLGTATFSALFYFIFES